MQNKIRFADDLLKEFHNNKNQPVNPKKIIFNDVDGYDVYNPTAPFIFQGQTYIVSRVESRDSENSLAVFFVLQEDGSYSPDIKIKRYKLQDPFVCFIHNQIVFGGTEIFPNPKDPSQLHWRAKFYYGTDLTDLKELTIGPDGMKDIRLVELKDQRIGVFTRPQGVIGGRGKIGFTIISNLQELSATVINGATLIELFDDKEWGGCNEATLLNNGKIGILGHIAKFTTGEIRHYYPMVFCLDPKTKEYYGMKIIAERKNLLDGPAKRQDLIDVLFSSGLVRNNLGKATLYTGVSDVEVQSIEIEDPFLRFE